MTVVTVAAMAVALGAATANAKPPPQQKDKTSTTSYTVAADYGEVETPDPYFHIEAFKDARGAWIGFVEWNTTTQCAGQETPSPKDDQYVFYMYDFTGDQGPAPAEEVTVANRYASAHVAGWAPGQLDIQNGCTGDEQVYFEDLYVDIDLTGTSTTIRETGSSWFRSPVFRSSETFSFTGRTAVGTVAFSGGGLVDTTYTDVGGRIGLSKYRAMQIG
jgi:hypothetical protein